MEAGPRNLPGREQRNAPDDESPDLAGTPGDDGAVESDGSLPGQGEPASAGDDPGRGEPLTRYDTLETDLLEDEPPDERSFLELRPSLRLPVWQIIPIVVFGALGSLMFAFPLAFEFGDGGPVVAMLGLLLSCCAAGWAIMAARRVGYTWPGLPARGSGDRPDWRFVAGYTAFAALVALLAVWRVARLH